MMKHANRILFAVLAFTFLSATLAQGQFRNQLNSSSDYTGSVIKKEQPEPGNWQNLFNMTMDHSYNMMVSSLGGGVQSLNAYTNTMQFYFSEDLTGRLDISLLHSPFGNSFINQQNNGPQIIIRNAELNYQLGERSNISIHFQQLPSHGYGLGGSPWAPYRHNTLFGQNY